MLRGGVGSEPCSQVRAFLQREEKAKRTKRKIHILLIKPCISSITFKKMVEILFIQRRNSFLSYFRDTEICLEVQAKRSSGRAGYPIPYSSEKSKTPSFSL